MIRRVVGAVGLAFDIAKILLAPSPRRDVDDEAPVSPEPPTEPVVRVTPAAASMVARGAPAPTPRPAEDEPLEGSIAARRQAARW